MKVSSNDAFSHNLQLKWKSPWRKETFNLKVLKVQIHLIRKILKV